MFWIPALIGAASAAASAAAAANTKYPDQPNYGEAAWAGALQEAENLPARRQIEALARLGQRGSFDSGYSTVRMVDTPSDGLRPYIPSEWQEGGKYYSLTQGGTVAPSIIQMNVPGHGQRSVNFEGLGDADISAALSRQLAQGQLELERRYAPQFIEQELRMRELADPQGSEAYRLLQQQIMQDLDQADQAKRPVSDLLDRQVSEELGLGRQLTGDVRGQVEQSLSDRASVGDKISMADIEQGLTTGPAGEAREAGRRDRAIGYLASGTTPEDVAYRRQQQGLSNMASFLRGETPVAQFGQLSAAQSGATPIQFGPSLSGLTGQTQNLYTQGAARNYAGQVQNATSTANNWLAGLGVALQGGAAIANARR